MTLLIVTFFSFIFFKKIYFFLLIEINNSIDPIPVCQQTCIDFKNTCSDFLNTSAAEEIAQYLPDCATFPTQNCNNLDFVPPLGNYQILRKETKRRK